MELFSSFFYTQPYISRFSVDYTGSRMPQIRCPNCGCSINLETRKKMDFYLISKKLQSGPKSFTQLLHATQLPRKTLSLRLKELTERGTVIKDNGYRLSEASRDAPIKYQMRRGYRLKSKIYRFVKENPNGNRDALIIGVFLAFLIAGPLLFAHPFFVVHAHRVHNFDLQPLLGDDFTVSIGVRDAVDLYGWQGKIRFDPNVLVISDVTAGDFLSSKALVVNATGGFLIKEPQSPESLLIVAIDGSGVLSISGSLLGDVPGKSGSGRLVTITFDIASDPQENIEVNLVGDIILVNHEVRDAEGVLEIET